MSQRVLIIDDEETIRQMTRLTPEATGYEVSEAGSGMEAFRFHVAQRRDGHRLFLSPTGRVIEIGSRVEF